MNIERPIQILVKRRAALGDVIMSTAVVRELRKRYVNCEIDVATDFLDVYNNNPHVRNVFHTNEVPTVDNYDLYINLDNAYEYNPLNHYMDSYFHRAVGTSNVQNKSVELFESINDIEEVKKFIDKNELDQYIVIHIRQWHWALKNMSWTTWYSVFEQLFSARTDFKIVTVGSDSDGTVDHPLFVDARSILNIQQQKVLISRAKCFVGIDSGPFHVAATTNTHIIALQTHLLPERILPYRDGTMGYNTTAIMSNVDCVGCNDHQQRPVSQVICRYKDFRCKDNFDATRIANNILEIL